MEQKRRLGRGIESGCFKLPSLHCWCILSRFHFFVQNKRHTDSAGKREIEYLCLLWIRYLNTRHLSTLLLLLHLILWTFISTFDLCGITPPTTVWCLFLFCFFGHLKILFAKNSLLASVFRLATHQTVVFLIFQESPSYRFYISPSVGNHGIPKYPFIFAQCIFSVNLIPFQVLGDIWVYNLRVLCWSPLRRQFFDGKDKI